MKNQSYASQESILHACKAEEISPSVRNVKYAQCSAEEVTPRISNVKYAQMDEHRLI